MEKINWQESHGNAPGYEKHLFRFMLTSSEDGETWYANQEAATQVDALDLLQQRYSDSAIEQINFVKKLS